ncbi:MAG: aryl-sulfate sulfotransferase [Alphaproteobacteria bacterium]|nr:aryl-sulfate sulfotransferase [Alphaproteobacteria bacterium]
MLLVAALACHSTTPTADTPPDTDGSSTDTAETGTTPEETGGTTTTETGTPTGTSTLDVSCEVTEDNLLRYWCTVHAEPAAAIDLTFRRTDGLSVERSVHSDRATDHTVPVYLLASDTEYGVTVRGGGAEVTTTFTTAVVGAGLDVQVNGTGTSGLGWIGSKNPCNGSATAVIFDMATGQLVWYDNLEETGNFGKLDMVRFTPDGTVLGETGEDIVEIDMMGAEIAHLVGIRTLLGAGVTFWGLHHDVFSRNGLYYVMQRHSYEGRAGSDVLDVVTLLDASGTVVTQWDPNEHMVMQGWWGDWLHTNSIWVDENQDMILSFAARDAVAKVKGDPNAPDFGDVLWVMDSGGTRDNWGTTPAGTIDWGAVTPAAFGNEHDVGLTATGQLTMLDNDHGRGIVFDLDSGAGAATAIATYATDSAVCGEQGTMSKAPNGHVLVGCLGGALREYDENGQLVWELDRPTCASQGNGAGNPRWYALDL